VKKPLKLALISLLLFMVVVSAACAASDAGGSPQEAGSDGPVKATLAGGSPTGMLFMVCTGVSECVNKSYPGSAVTIVPGSVAANVIRINDNEVDAGMAHSAMLFAAANGKAPYNEVLDNTAAVASLYSSTYQIVLNSRLGIDSFGEMIKNKEKVRLSIDQPGSSASVAFERLLGEYGATIEDFESWGGEIVQKSQEDSAAMLSDGFIDGYAMQTLCPARAIQESAAGQELTLLSFEPGIIGNMVDKYGYEWIIIPKEAYDFMDQDVESFSTNTVLTVPADAPDDLAYKLARSLVENIDYMREIHAGLKGLTPEGMASETGVPLHPGAEKYYREIGIL